MHQLKHNKRSQNTLHIKCQNLHVSAPRSHHQGVYQHQNFMVPTPKSGDIHPIFPHKS